jgi:hypothetical protein
MELKIEQITPYLPYNLMCKVQGEENVSFEFQGVSDCTWIDLHEIGRTVNEQYDIEDVYPILKPMDEAEDYFDKIYGCLEHQDVTEFMDADFLSEHNLEIGEFRYWEVEYIPYGTLKVLLKHHFDVFGLIVEKLAVSCS